LGGHEQAKIVAEIFTRSIASDPQLSKLIHSSFDIDRWDYLWRDSHGTGVPYGYIDINYLLNNLRVSPDKILGFSHKALPAIEHFLLARFFMYRVVYYHKTTFGMEEACRQLLRRLRDGYGEKYKIPSNGDEVKKLVKSGELNTFTDAFVDGIIQQAVNHEGNEDKDKVIRELAYSIQSRRPPKLIKEVQVCEESGRKHHEGTAFFEKCRNNLKSLSEEFHIPLGQFLLCKPNVTIMKAPRQYKVSELTGLNADELRAKEHEEEEEQIWIFKDEKLEPESFWNLEHSLIKKCANYFVQSFRLYVVYESEDSDSVITKLSDYVKDWD